MKNYIKKSLKASNGITLIALVITIIVLLILAGISISMLSGDNSILQRATDAKTQTGIGQEKETIALAYNSALATKVSNGDSSAVTSSELDNELNSSEASASGNSPIIVEFTNGHTYSIDDNGSINEYTPPQNIQTNVAMYGDIVEYGGILGKDIDGNDLTWKFFYDDGTNIYLIASDYVRRNNSALSRAMSYAGAINGDGSYYTIRWSSNNSFKIFKTQTSTSTTASSGSSDIFSSNASIGTQYLISRGFLSHWYENVKTSTSSYVSAKLTSCLLDTRIWSGFVANECETASNYSADNTYAIGGPTLSMWVESWNTMHGENSLDDSSAQIYYNSLNKNGYIVKIGETPSSSDYYVDLSNSTAYVANEYDKLYFPHKAEYGRCQYYLLASPSSYTDQLEICSVHCSGKLTYSVGTNCYCAGVRPVVCLPSNVKLSTSKIDGKYTIVNKE